TLRARPWARAAGMRAEALAHGPPSTVKRLGVAFGTVERLVEAVNDPHGGGVFAGFKAGNRLLTHPGEARERLLAESGGLPAEDEGAGDGGAGEINGVAGAIGGDGGQGGQGGG